MIWNVGWIAFEANNPKLSQNYTFHHLAYCELNLKQILPKSHVKRGPRIIQGLSVYICTEIY